MFNKLIANLSISPSSMDQVVFYGKRLKREQSIRRIGLVLVVLSMIVQLFAVMSPPQKALAADPNNDVIPGGVNSVAQLKREINQNKNVRSLYARFGLTVNDMDEKGEVKNQGFRFQRQGDKGARTVGRVNYASTKDHLLGTFGGTKYYSRSAAEWQGSEEAFYFGVQKGTDNHYYKVWVLKECGNIAYQRTEKPAKPDKVATFKPTGNTTIQKDKTKDNDLNQTQQTQTQETITTEETPDTPVTPETPDTPDTPNTPEIPNLQYAKMATNLTQGLTPGRTTTTPANASDVIEYTLAITNSGKTAVKDFTVEDNIADVLEYADVDQAFLAGQDGTYSAEAKSVIWKNQTVPANGQLKKVFRMNMKAAIPSTNSPNATSPSYDCKMQNVYGNDVTVPVNCSVIKTVEGLPNTGPGTTVAIGFTISVLSGYFFMRSRLLAKEVGLIRKSYQTAA